MSSLSSASARPSAPAAGRRVSSSTVDSDELSGSIDISESPAPKAAAPASGKAVRASPDPTKQHAGDSISLDGSIGDVSGDLSFTSKKSSAPKQDDSSKAPAQTPAPEPEDSGVSFSTQSSMSKRSPIKTPLSAPTPKKTPKATTAPVVEDDEEDSDAESADVSFSSKASAPKAAAAAAATKAAKTSMDGDGDSESAELSFSTIASARQSPAPKPAENDQKAKQKADEQSSDDEEDDSTVASATQSTPQKPAAPTKSPAPDKGKTSSQAGSDSESEVGGQSSHISLSSQTSLSKRSGAPKPPVAPKALSKSASMAEDGDEESDQESGDISVSAKRPAVKRTESSSSRRSSVSASSKATTATVSVAAAPAAAKQPLKSEDSTLSHQSVSTVASTSKTSGTAASKPKPKTPPKAPKKAASSAAGSEYSDEFDEDKDDGEDGTEASVSRSISLRREGSKSGSVKGKSFAEESVAGDADSSSTAASSVQRSNSKSKGAGKVGATSKASRDEKEEVEEEEEEEEETKEKQGTAPVTLPTQKSTPAKAKAKGDDDDGYSDDDDFVKEDEGEDGEEGDWGDDKVPPLKSQAPGGSGSGASRPASSTKRPPSARPSARPSSAQQHSGVATPPSHTPTTHRSETSLHGDDGDDDVQNSMDEEDSPPRQKGGAGSGAGTPPRPSGTFRPASAVGKLQGTPSPAGGRRPYSAGHEDSWEGEVRTPSAAIPPRGGRPYSGRSLASDADYASSSGARPASATRQQQRPSSAAPRMRQGAQVSELARRHPTTWDVRDVCMWVDSIGLGQYRKKFMHNIVDGRMLLMMTDDQMKVELGIGPMGHRVALLRAIEGLLDEYESAQQDGYHAQAWAATSSRERPSSARPTSAVRTRPPQPEHPRRPASASPAVIPPDRYLGPAAGKMTVYEQRSKLLFELDRAAQRAAQHKAVADQLAHTANLSEEEVLRLRALLQDLEYKNRLQVQHATGSLDSHSRIPWRPVGHGSKLKNMNPERLAQPGDDPTLDMTFKPRLSKETRRMFKEAAANQSTFLDRLENDLKKRDRSKKELDRKYYSTEALFQDPTLAVKQYKKDHQFLQDYFASKGLLEEQLAERDPKLSEQLEDVVSSYASDWRLKDRQVAAISAAKGDKKVKAVASAIRTMQFMQRYESELKQRDDKLVSLQKKWWELTMGKPTRKEGEDRSQLIEYFGLLGWKGEGEEGVTDLRLRALLTRAREYKKEWEVWKDRNRDRPADVAGDPQVSINWDAPPWSVDGLGPLMEAEMQRIKDAAESQPVPSTGKTVTTKHAGDAAIAVSQMVVGQALDYLTYTVKLLAGLRWDSLEKLESIEDISVKRLAVYRGIRTQKFLEFTEAKIRERERSLQELYSTLVPQKKVITSQQQDGFFERLLDDANKRRARVEKLMNEKMAKEKEILGSTKLYARRTTR